MTYRLQEQVHVVEGGEDGRDHQLEALERLFGLRGLHGEQREGAGCVGQHLLARATLSSALLGTMALMGKGILVRLKSPLMIFLPMILIISLPMPLMRSTCFWSSHSRPPLE